MSRHEGVSCDSCMKANFRGRRYKCLVCYDYDLCSNCYEAGATTTRHTTDHAMQCILTRADFDLYYGGESVSAEQPQSFVCPYCGKMGYTDSTLQEHVAADHPESPTEVVCPICAALPGGEPNHVTDDFAAHLQLDHRSSRDFEEPMGIRHVRRIPHPTRGGARTRRNNMQFHTASGGAGSSVGGGAGTLAGLAPNSRETMDPIAELLSQLSSVRSRAAAAQSVSSQLQQLEMQLQSTRYPHITRQQLERLPRRPTESKTVSQSSSANVQPQNTLLDYAGAVMSTGGTASKSSSSSSDYLLSKIGEPDLSEADKQGVEVEQANRSIFVQELLLSSMSETLRLSDDSLSNSCSSVDNYTDGVLNGDNDNTSGEGGDLGREAKTEGSEGGGGSSHHSGGRKEGNNNSPCSTSGPKTDSSTGCGNDGNGGESAENSSTATASAAVNCSSSSSSNNMLGIAHSNTVSGGSNSATGVSFSSNLASSSSSALPKEKVLSKMKSRTTQQVDGGAMNLEKEAVSPTSLVKK